MAGVLKLTNCVVIIITMFCTEATGTLHVCSDSENFAFNKPAYQSSTYTARGQLSVAERAVDGNRQANFYDCNSCTHTLPEDNPWWMVDLLQEFYIHRVEITNRLDQRFRFTNLDIETSENYKPSTGLIKPTLCFHIISQAAGSTVTYACNSIVLGRYVKVTLLKNDILDLCEVRVFGETKYTNQSSEASIPCMKNYSVLKRGRIPSVTPILTERMRSRTGCAQKCGFTSGCLAFAVTRHSTFDWECSLFDCNSDASNPKQNTTLFVLNVQKYHPQLPKF